MAQKNKKTTIEFREDIDVKTQYTSILAELGLTKSEHLRGIVKETISQREELLRLNNENLRNRKQVFNSVSIVDTFERNIEISIPEKLINREKFENSVLLDRISSVLSLNDLDEAYTFTMGLVNLIDQLSPNSTIIFTETDSKGRISTKLVRNPFGIAIIFTLIGAIDKGHKIKTFTDSLNSIRLEDLFILLSDGISHSIHERTKVYDNLFFEKYSKSHFNQWLQWTFGLSRREPIEEFERLLRKNPKIVVDKSDIVERSNKAKSYLAKRRKLFVLSEEGLQLANTKIDQFVELLQNYGGDYNPTKSCKNANIHDMLISNNRKCPLKCGLMPK